MASFTLYVLNFCHRLTIAATWNPTQAHGTPLSCTQCASHVDMKRSTASLVPSLYSPAFFHILCAKKSWGVETGNEARVLQFSRCTRTRKSLKEALFSYLQSLIPRPLPPTVWLGMRLQLRGFTITSLTASTASFFFCMFNFFFQTCLAVETGNEARASI